jgi:hypothetical protein
MLPAGAWLSSGVRLRDDCGAGSSTGVTELVAPAEPMLGLVGKASVGVRTTERRVM